MKALGNRFVFAMMLMAFAAAASFEVRAGAAMTAPTSLTLTTDLDPSSESIQQVI